MARLLRRILFSVLAVVAVGAGLWFWASSGTLSSDELAQTRTYAEADSVSDTLSVMTYNIGYLSGMTNNLPVERDRALFDSNLASAIDMLDRVDPDVIAVQEIDFDAGRSFHVHQLDTLARRLSYLTAAQAVNWDVRYLPFPYGWPSVHFGRVLSGQAILSRYPIVDHRRQVLAKTSRPYVSRVFYLDRLAQVADVVIGSDTLSIVNVHLEAFEQPVRETQAAEVRELVAPLLASGRPVLLVGDFNAVPDDASDETLRRVTSGLSLNRAMPDTTQHAGTYPGDDPKRLIDHIFYATERIVPIGTRIDCGPPDAPPSDHCAVTMTFRLSADENNAL
ncbi:endonuclease/exonuclease/phosphatase family protein [Longibacter sp.]|jgi:endonuclease/exonuclease/phosphatase family metal-dependent hydrolase|uniref:endonuclease/exonuclease/phosphatase family protein n=1 Tax=Longibacter sp. TaxID=2045415 RepID=UPI003EB86847